MNLCIKLLYDPSKLASLGNREVCHRRGASQRKAATEILRTPSMRPKKELARIEIKQRKEGENALRLSDSPRIMSPESAEKYV